MAVLLTDPWDRACQLERPAENTFCSQRLDAPVLREMICKVGSFCKALCL